ncbi:MAG TPA: alkaline phosphatase family protein [Planctomycetota bacterium]|nr:alkaline phosphatase family protein [Planctomycetota bacterium]
MTDDIHLTIRDGGKPFNVPTGQPASMKLDRYERHTLGLDGDHFHFDSAVLLPIYEPDQNDDSLDTSGTPDPGSLHVIATCLREAREHPERKLLVTGHADTTGSAAYNVTLTEKRARSVLAVLLGKKDDWVTVALAQHKYEDVQQILSWIAKMPGWESCDPGKIDNVPKQQVTDATKAFQDLYSKQFPDRKLDPTGTVDKKTWGAFFDMYSAELEAQLGTDPDGLSSDYQTPLASQLYDKKSVGCGKSFPAIQADKDQLRCKENRRVELIFFDPGQEPTLACHPHEGTCTPEKCEVFNDRLYKLDPVPADEDLGPPYLWIVAVPEFEPLPASCDPLDGSGTIQPPELKFSTLGQLPLKRIPDTAKKLRITLDDSVGKKHDKDKTVLVWELLETGKNDPVAKGQADKGQLTFDIDVPNAKDGKDFTLEVGFGPFLWFLDETDRTPVAGKVLAWDALEPIDKSEKTPSLLATIPFDDRGRAPIEKIPAATKRIEVVLARQTPGKYVLAKTNGIFDGGHYHVTDAAGTLLVAGQLQERGSLSGSITPDDDLWRLELRTIPDGERFVTIATHDDTKRRGKSHEKIKHVFVLMLENRSYDHMLGHNTELKEADGLVGRTFTNEYIKGKSPAVADDGARPRVIVDPGHEFEHAHAHLFANGPADPSQDPNDPSVPLMKGFAAKYHFRCSGGEPVTFPFDYHQAIQDALSANGTTADEQAKVVMQGFNRTTLPVLNRLAEEFAVCDRWFAALPGPTQPNRFFVHAASSAGLDDSPSAFEVLTQGGFTFENGTIYDKIEKEGGTQLRWRVYEGTKNQSGIHLLRMPSSAGQNMAVYTDDFPNDLKTLYPTLQGSYTFIEPWYGPFFQEISDDPTWAYLDGRSQHPVGHIAKGEQVIESVYSWIASQKAIWESSVLIVIYDEHGGFADHVPPPPAVPPGDERQFNKAGFDFGRQGVRVPAVIISPWIAKGVTDHTVYDHATVAATVFRRFGLTNMTNRDLFANDLLHLFTLDAARAPVPWPIGTAAVPVAAGTSRQANLDAPVSSQGYTFLYGLAKAAAARNPDQGDAIMKRAQQVKTVGDAEKFMKDVAPEADRDQQMPPQAPA